MIKDVFEFKDYRSYLIQALNADGERGRRSRLAEALRCQPAFISRALKGEVDFSQEHAIVINSFLQHRPEEADYFIALLDYERAGSRALKDYHSHKLEQMRSNRQIVAERIGVKQVLSKEDQMIYYSSWYYAAIHVLLMVPELRNPQRLSERINLPLPVVKDVLDFLSRIGLATIDKNGYRPGVSRMHLAKDSPMLAKHHTNWRIRAIDALDVKDPGDLHYSGPICISKEVAGQVQEILLRALAEAEPLIKGALDEEVYCLNMDFFKV